eukprot:TRINITY_DN12371_c0_g1_i1.p1 TRINITY_DN12371_c0_g1~~TRINITY_DN12371_c0_g1_i1.p1  ORF type:complete len:246 (-),score=39.67 TRINITY_DN12371_c0_g1_i1:432-1169(-)
MTKHTPTHTELNHDELAHIFSFLYNSSDLFNMRYVCHLWEEAAAPLLRKMYKVFRIYMRSNQGLFVVNKSLIWRKHDALDWLMWIQLVDKGGLFVGEGFQKGVMDYENPLFYKCHFKHLDLYEDSGVLRGDYSEFTVTARSKYENKTVERYRQYTGEWTIEIQYDWSVCLVYRGKIENNKKKYPLKRPTWWKSPVEKPLTLEKRFQIVYIPGYPEGSISLQDSEGTLDLVGYSEETWNKKILSLI